MSELHWNDKDLGPVDAYALAVAGGYEGTKQQWINEIANASNNAQTASEKATIATTKAAEATAAAATASAAYNVNLLAPNYSAESTYKVGDHVIYSGGYYECISAISTAEEWTAAHWRQLTVGGEASNLKSAITKDEYYIADLQETVGQGFTASKSVAHGSTVSANDTYAIPLKVKKGGIIRVSLTDENNTGKAFTTYVKYTGSNTYTNVSSTTTGGNATKIVAANDIDAIGFYKGSLTDGTLNISAEVSYGGGLADKVEELQIAESKDNENIQKSYNTTGANYCAVNEFSHGSTIEAIDSESILVNAKKGCIIDLLVTDSDNTGASLVIYYKTNGSFVSISRSTIVGTEISIYANVDVERVGLYGTSLTSGTVRIEATVHHTMGDSQTLDYISPLVFDGENGSVVNLLNQACGTSGIGAYNSTRLSTVPIYFAAGAEITIKRRNMQYCCLLWENEIKADNIKRNDDWKTLTEETIKPTFNGYCVFMLRKSNNADIVPSDFTGNISVKTGIKVELTEASEKIEYIRETSRTYEQGASARALYLVLDKPIKAGTPFMVTIKDPNTVMSTDYIAFYISANGSDYVRDNEIKRNIPTIKSYDFDIYGFEIYGTSSATGIVTLSVETLSETGDEIAKTGLSYFMRVPDYYFTNNYLSGKISRIKELINACACNGDIFFFITDQHWETHNQKHSPALIKYIAERINIPRLFSGGDMQHSGIAHELNECYKMAFHGKRYYAVGNHEYAGGTTTENEIAAEYYLENDDIVYGDSGRHYYYVDNKQKKIRYIVLSAYAPPESGQTAASNGYTTEQKSWLQNTALNVESGWTIIIFTHCLYNIGISTSNMEVYDSDTRNIIEGYNGNGVIAAVIQGHTHRDRYTTLSNGVPVIISTCDKNKVWSSGGHDDLDVTRNDGTIAEQAFEVVIVNKTTRKINMVRIGAQARNGSGNTPGDLVEEREFNY